MDTSYIAKFYSTSPNLSGFANSSEKRTLSSSDSPRRSTELASRFERPTKSRVTVISPREAAIDASEYCARHYHNPGRSVRSIVKFMAAGSAIQI